MKSLISVVTLMAAMLLPASTSAQFSSSPLEPGLYNCLKQLCSGDNYDVMLVSDSVLTLAAGSTSVLARYVSPEQVTLSGVVAKCGPEPLSLSIQQQIERYLLNATIGTLAVDRERGEIVMRYYVNPRQVSTPVIARLVISFSQALDEQQRWFAERVAAN